MPSDILDYCGVRLMIPSGDTAFTSAVTHASEIAAQWNTGAALYDDGVDRYVAWGNTEGTFNVYELETEDNPSDVHKVLNDYENALTAVVQTDSKGVGNTPVAVITFTECLYNTGAISKKLRPLGDRYVVEGAVDFKIYKNNAA